MNIIDEFLTEAKKSGKKAKTKMVRLSKSGQVDRQAGAVAMRMAKDANDPLHAKYVKWNKKRKEIRGKIRKKYGIRAKKAAKKAML